MGKQVAFTGNDAGAEALKDVNPDVAAVFPITPQTELMHKFSSFVNDGVVDTELVPVESEHSAQSACFGAAASGAISGSTSGAGSLAGSGFGSEGATWATGLSAESVAAPPRST